MLQQSNRITGGILGVIIGDALGLPVQFLTREEILKDPITGMRGYGTFNYPAGTWSDDSSLTLCLVDCFVEAGYDLQDLSQRFLKWYEEGYWTPFGEAFDIGRATAEAMENLKHGVEALQAGPRDERSNGNGSLMRILPAALYFVDTPDKEFVERLTEISRVTHGHPRSQLGCALYGLIVKELLAGKDAAQAYEALRGKANVMFKGTPLEEELSAYQRILDGSLAALGEDKIKSSGYVVDTLEAALWCLIQSFSFKETLLKAVNLGEDTDTVGAVVGGLAGVYYGSEEIPKEWVGTLIRKDEILRLIESFVVAAIRG